MIDIDLVRTAIKDDSVNMVWPVSLEKVIYPSKGATSSWKRLLLLSDHLEVRGSKPILMIGSGQSASHKGDGMIVSHIIWDNEVWTAKYLPHEGPLGKYEEPLGTEMRIWPIGVYEKIHNLKSN